MLMFLLSTTASMVSCGDDDDSGDEPNTSQTVWRVTSYGGEYMTFIYGADSQLDTVRMYDAYNWVFAHDAGTVTDTISNDKATVIYNRQGYITNLIWSEHDRREHHGRVPGDNWPNATMTENFTYDSEGHLTKHTSVTSYQKMLGDENLVERIESSTTYTWADGLLTEAMTSSTSTYANGSTWTGTYRLTYDYSNGTTNRLRQLPPSLFPNNVEFVSAMCIAGKLGIGPVTLPASLTEETQEGEDILRTNTFQLTFSLNADGTISSDNGNTVTYVTDVY